MKQVDYDQLAESYDQRYEARPYSGVRDTLQHVLPESGSVLEVGCGTGRWLGSLEGRGTIEVGLDPSVGMLRRALEQAPRFSVLNGVAEALPFADDSFDAVFVVNAIHHFRDPIGFVAEAVRVLRPGGCLLVIGLDPSQDRDTWYVYEYFESTVEGDRQRYPSHTSISGWMADAGLDGITTVVAEHLDETVEARPFLEAGGAAKHETSQLALLSDQCYSEGLDQIRAELASAESRGEVLQLRADLLLYATTGTAGKVGVERGAT